MLESIIVASIICFTLLMLAAVGAWAATMPTRQKMKLENAQLKMNQDLHAINMEEQRSISALRLQQYLGMLNNGEMLPELNSGETSDVVKEFKKRTERIEW